MCSRIKLGEVKYQYKAKVSLPPTSGAFQPPAGVGFRGFVVPLEGKVRGYGLNVPRSYATLAEPPKLSS